MSAVTFATAVTLLDGADVPVEGFAPALLAMLEVPGIVIALLLAAGVASRGSSGWGTAVRDAVLGKSIVLLIGGLVIGPIAGPDGTAAGLSVGG